MMARTRRELAVAERPQLAAQRRLAQRYPELVPEPLHQVLQPPAHHAMDSRNRAALHQGPQGLAVAGAQLADIPRRLAVNQAFGPMGVEPHHGSPAPSAGRPRRPAPPWSACRHRRSRPAPAAVGSAQHCGSLWLKPAAGLRHSLCEARSLGAWQTSCSPAWNQTCAQLKTPNESAFMPVGIRP